MNYCKKHDARHYVGTTCQFCERDAVMALDRLLTERRMNLLQIHKGGRLPKDSTGARFNTPTNNYWKGQSEQPVRWVGKLFQVWIRGSWMTARREEWVIS